MAEASPIMPLTEASRYELTLRELQEESIQTLLIATIAVGTGLVVGTPRFPQVWRPGVLGIFLMLLAWLGYLLLRRCYLMAAWILWTAWLSGALAVLYNRPTAGAACLLALPVGLATLFISARAGLFTGILVSVISVLTLSASPQTSAVEACLLAGVAVWGVLLLARCSTLPMQTAIVWAWHSYMQARQQLEVARDRQAELNQAVKDLAENSLKMARLNQLLGAARRAAEEAERVKAEFVANVSHELRTPLSMIIGFSEMILNAPATYGQQLPATLLADVAAIRRNSQHLANLINDVLDISQVEARRMSLYRDWASLQEIVEVAAQAVQPLFYSRGLYLRTRVAADLPPVYCDRTRMRQVVLNLVTNAARFTDKGGVVIEARSDGEKVVVSVADTGTGIAEADLAKVFEPFRQLDGGLRRREGGSGLGLNISRQFVELHGGEMGVRSQLGRGSTFWFALPLHPKSADIDSAGRWLSPDTIERRRSSLTPKPRLVPRIVILEPNDVLHEAVSRYLDDVQVESANSTVQTRALLEEPAQVLLIRGESHEQTAAWLRDMHETPHSTPVVACTLPIAAAAPCAGISAYLTKPITRERLLAAIEALGRPVSRILLVDDDTEALQLFSRLLSTSPQHYGVLQASSGPEALELMRTRQPDLLLLDLLMPGMDGFAVLEEKEADPRVRDIPVIILSAHDPAGAPIVAPSLLATRTGGLSLPDLLRAAMAVSEVLMVQRPARDPVLPGMPHA